MSIKPIYYSQLMCCDISKATCSIAKISVGSTIYESFNGKNPSAGPWIHLIFSASLDQA